MRGYTSVFPRTVFNYILPTFKKNVPNVLNCKAINCAQLHIKKWQENSQWVTAVCVPPCDTFLQFNKTNGWQPRDVDAGETHTPIKNAVDALEQRKVREVNMQKRHAILESISADNSEGW